MPDALFADPRLAPLYDALDGPRDDLDHYVAIVRELSARSALDVGGGTGSLALRLAEIGLDVTVVDPAGGSLDGDEWAAVDRVAATVRTPSGLVARTVADLEASWPFVSFSHDYDFPDGTRVTSSSTLRFRGRAEVEQSLDQPASPWSRSVTRPTDPAASTSSSRRSGTPPWHDRGCDGPSRHLDRPAVPRRRRRCPSGVDRRLSDELDVVNAAATPGVPQARELTVRLLDDDSELAAGLSGWTWAVRPASR